MSRFSRPPRVVWLQARIGLPFDTQPIDSPQRGPHCMNTGFANAGLAAIAVLLLAVAASIHGGADSARSSRPATLDDRTILAAQPSVAPPIGAAPTRRPAPSPIAANPTASAADSPARQEANTAVLLRARQQPELAHKLAMSLWQCAQIERHYAGLSDPSLDARQLRDATARVESLDRQCGDWSAHDIGRFGELLGYAADAGVTAAQLAYPNVMADSLHSDDPVEVERYRLDSLRHLRSAAMTGQADALLQLGLASLDGTLARRSRFDAYKYVYAYRSARGGAPSDRLLSQIARGLSPEQQLAARKEATAIYRRCCATRSIIHQD